MHIFREAEMSRENTKISAKSDAEKAKKLAQIKKDIARFKLNSSVADKMVEKYGIDCAYNIIRQSMQAPANVMSAMGKPYCNTKKAIEYFANNTLDDATVAKGIGKTAQYVTTSKKKSQYTPAKEVVKDHPKVRQAEAKKQECNKKVTQKTQQRSAAKTQQGVRPPLKKVESSILLQNNPLLKEPPTIGNPFQIASQPLTAEESAKAELERMNKDAAGRVDIKSLMKAGVTSEDLQAVLSDKNKLSQLTSGNTGNRLAKAADRVIGRCNGGCLAGAQGIFATAGYTYIEGNSSAWPKKEWDSSSNSGCNMYVPLEKSGEFVTLTVKNEAYKKPEGSLEERKMREFNKQLPAGTPACVDNFKPDDVYGRRSLQNDGQKHGHAWVQNNRGASCSDGVQPDGPKFSRYGKNMHISLPKDTKVPENIAEQLLTRAKERERMAQTKIAIAQKGR